MKTLRKNEFIYLQLAIILTAAKIFFDNLYPADQLLIFNFLSLLMITVVAIRVMGLYKVFYYIPLFFLFYFFMSPEILKYFFTTSHVLILLLIIWLLVKQEIMAKSPARLNFAALPIEIVIILSF